MKEAKILLIGGAIIDILANPVSEDVFSIGSLPAENILMSTGGDALNEAINLTSMGTPVYLSTVIGDDKGGNFIMQHCKEHGIRFHGNPVRKEFSTGINLVLIKPDGSRHFITNPNGGLRKWGLSDVPFPFPETVKILNLASIFVSPLMTPDQLAILFSKAKEAGITVCADMTKCKNKETISDLGDCLKNIDYLFPNDEEAMLFTREKTAEAAAYALHAAGVKHVVVKCGAKGCFIKSASFEGYLAPERKCKCIDTTGAGDSFVSGFLQALSEDQDLISCAQRGNQWGARCVESVGASSWTESLDM